MIDNSNVSKVNRFHSVRMSEWALTMYVVVVYILLNIPYCLCASLILRVNKTKCIHAAEGHPPIPLDRTRGFKTRDQSSTVVVDPYVEVR